MHDEPFNDLEYQWRPLLTKMSNRWAISGMDRDDIYQELLLVLWDTSRKYSPDHGAVFKTYLYRACTNRLMTISDHAGTGKRPRKRAVPARLITSLDEGSDARGAMYDNLGLIDMFTGASPEARGVARRVILDEFDWRTKKRIKRHVRDELWGILKENE